MFYKNSNYKSNGYKVYGRKVTHSHNSVCSECKEQNEVATIWNRKNHDFDYTDICKACAVKIGYEVIS